MNAVDLAVLTATAIGKLAIPAALLAGCPNCITVDQPAKGVVVDTTFDVAIHG